MLLGLFPGTLFSAPIFFPEAELDAPFLSFKGGLVSLGAEMEAEFLEPKGDDDIPFTNGDESVFHTNQSVAKFRLDKVTLIPQLNINDKIRFYAEIEAYANRADAETTIFREAALSFFLPHDLFIQMGLDDRFISPEFMADNGAVGENKRLTESYPINGTAFWEDEDLGLTVGGNHAFDGEKTRLFWRLSFTNGLNLDHDEITRNRIFPILADDRDANIINLDVSDKKELGSGIGVKRTFSDAYNVGLFGFFYYSRLSGQDVDFLIHVIPGYSHRKHMNYFAGANAEFNASKFNLFSQYIYAMDGKVRRDGFYVQPSVLFETDKRKYVNAFRLLYRFNYLDVDAEGVSRNLSTSPFTWDRRTHTAAFNIQIHKLLTFRNEFHWNLEKTGGSPKRIKNDEFLSQIELRF